MPCTVTWPSTIDQNIVSKHIPNARAIFDMINKYRNIVRPKQANNDTTISCDTTRHFFLRNDGTTSNTDSDSKNAVISRKEELGQLPLHWKEWAIRRQWLSTNALLGGGIERFPARSVPPFPSTRVYNSSVVRSCKTNKIQNKQELGFSSLKGTHTYRIYQHLPVKQTAKGQLLNACTSIQVRNTTIDARFWPRPHKHKTSHGGPKANLTDIQCEQVATPTPGHQRKTPYPSTMDRCTHSRLLAPGQTING